MKVNVPVTALKCMEMDNNRGDNFIYVSINQG